MMAATAGGRYTRGMRLHRFYVDDSVKLEHSFWLHDEKLLHQWQHVLRLAPGAEVVLFDGIGHDRLYTIEQMNKNEAQLKHMTDLENQRPARDVYLFWSLLKKDKNDWVLQKCTELGVSHFVPLLATRSEMKNFNLERAQKIIVEAAEQCGRSDIPSLREPMLVDTAIEDYHDKATLYVAEQSSSAPKLTDGSIGVFIGPEGGWTDSEKQLFKEKGVAQTGVSRFTLRAETAAVIAAGKLVQ